MLLQERKIHSYAVNVRIKSNVATWERKSLSYAEAARIDKTLP